MSVDNSTVDPLQEDIIFHFLVQFIFYALYGIIFFLGTLGNVLVCYVVCSNRAMQTVTNLFITNLALSDILLCLVIPFTPLYTFIGRWIFGRVVCHLVPYVQATSVYVSTLTLTAIAIDRFFVILYPLKQRMKLSTCMSVLFGIWITAMLVTLPYGIYMRVDIVNGREVCEEDWPIESFEIYFGVSTLLLQFVIPFCIIAYCYYRISRRLNERAKSKPGTKSARKEEADREKKRRTNRMLIAMVTIFGICWFPLNFVNLLNDVGSLGIYFHLVFFMAHCVAVSSTCYNPFLYAWLNENFRKEFKHALPCPLRNVANRYCGTEEHTMDTLLQSTTATPITKLQPREPLAERIMQSEE